MNAVNPFQKVRSILERKNIWQGDWSELLVKVGEDVLAADALNFNSEGIWIQLRLEKEQAPWDILRRKIEEEKNLIGYLSAKSDRYFFSSSSRDFLMSPLQAEIFIKYVSDLYKLERRASPRVLLPTHLRLKSWIEEVQGLKTHLPSEILDISGGGLRVSVLDSRAVGMFSVGMEVIIHVWVNPNKQFPVHGVIRHVHDTPHATTFGLQALDSKIKSTNRLLAQTLLLQQKVLNSQD